MSEGTTTAIVAVVGFIGTVIVFFCGFRYATRCMGQWVEEVRRLWIKTGEKGYVLGGGEGADDLGEVATGTDVDVGTW
jgi:hypothetical protein